MAMVFFPLAALRASPEPNCAKPVTTYEMNVCGSREVQQARSEMQRYFSAAKARMEKDEPQAVKSLDDAQSAWQTFSVKHCASVYARWEGGTVRGPASVQCAITLTRARTHQLWREFLTYPDRTPSLLPEPKQ
jgi:uncharacterized protein YecT (DUF1311 family)